MISDEKRMQFESSRQRSIDENKRRAARKVQEMQQIFEDSKRIELEKRDKMLKNIKASEIRQELLKKE